MKRRVRAVVAYNGSRLKGWQIQGKGERTAQGELARALEKMTGTRIKTHGASRTDAGVHAAAQTAHFDCRTKLSARVFKEALNFHLPADIAVRSLSFAAEDFHSRYNAKSKWYRFLIYNSNEKPVFHTQLMQWVAQPLNLGRMKRAAKHLVGRHDFSSFCTPHHKPENAERTVTRLVLNQERDVIRVDVRANGFLNNMVRIIVGTLIEVGREKLGPADVKRILGSKDRLQAGPTAKAHGLTLLKVYY